MGYYKKLLALERIRDSMLDEKSRMIFDARVDYMITRDSEEFLKVIDTLEDEWSCPEVEEALARTEAKGVVIFGCGHDGKKTRKVLEQCNYQPAIFCDSDSTKVGSHGADRPKTQKSILKVEETHHSPDVLKDKVGINMNIEAVQDTKMENDRRSETVFGQSGGGG